VSKQRAEITLNVAEWFSVVPLLLNERIVLAEGDSKAQESARQLAVTKAATPFDLLEVFLEDFFNFVECQWREP